MAALVNFGLHPAILAGDNWLYSADYPGYMVEALSRTLGSEATCLFLNGCCGDVNHVDYRDPIQGRGYQMAQRVGYMLAAAAHQAIECRRAIPANCLRVSREQVRARTSEDQPARAADGASRSSSKPESILRRARWTACPTPTSRSFAWKCAQRAGQPGSRGSHGDPASAMWRSSDCRGGILPVGSGDQTSFAGPRTRWSPACATMPSATCRPRKRSSKAATRRRSAARSTNPAPPSGSSNPPWRSWSGSLRQQATNNRGSENCEAISHGQTDHASQRRRQRSTCIRISTVR